MYCKAGLAKRLLLRDTMDHATPLKHVLTIDADCTSGGVEFLHNTERDCIHRVIVFGNEDDSIAHVIIDIGAPEPKALAPSRLNRVFVCA